jgi:hypothetical protein
LFLTAAALAACLIPSAAAGQAGDQPAKEVFAFLDGLRERR